MSVSIHEHEFVVAERDALRREVDALRREAGRTITEQSRDITKMLRDMEAHYKAALEAEQVRFRQLAASQAREQQLREALDYVKLHNTVVGSLLMGAHSECPDTWRGYYDDALNHSDYITKRLESAITIQSDTTALEAIITKAGEVMRERCFAIGHNASIDDSIRALPAITLDDLKGGA